MSREIIEVTCADGWRLKLEAIPPPEGAEVRGAVWVGHAMMANRRSLDKPTGEGLGSTLAAAGFHVYLADLRGHGESGPLAGEGGIWSYDDIVFKDIPAVTRAVKERHPDLPLAVTGHSLTGHTTLAALGEIEGLPIDAVVSIASNAWVHDLEPSPVQWAKKKAFLVPFVATAKLRGYFPARDLKAGSDDEARKYVEQFGHWADSGVWGTVDGKTNYLEGLARVRCPVLAVAGGGDKLMCPIRDARAFHARLYNAPVTFWEVTKDSRFGYDADHMSLVTSPKGKKLWEAMGEWLKEVFAKP